MKRIFPFVGAIAVSIGLAGSVLASESATATLSLDSVGGTAQNPIYNYNLVLNNTGTTGLGTFWFSWVPGEDFMKSAPTDIGAPFGWLASTVNEGSFDGYSIEFYAYTAPNVAIGHSLSGFSFSSPDSPQVMSGNSPSYSNTPILTAFTYSGFPETEPGFQFLVTNAAIPEPMSGCLLLAAGALADCAEFVNKIGQS